MPVLAGVSKIREALPQGVHLEVVEAEGSGQYEDAFATMSKEHTKGLVILGDVMFTRDSVQIAELALSHRLPSIYLYRVFALAGGLLSYGPDEETLIRLAADYVPKILQGVNPGDLPVQQPTTFHLAVNLKTAKALGLAIPQSLLQRADQVIE